MRNVTGRFCLCVREEGPGKPHRKHPWPESNWCQSRLSSQEFWDGGLATHINEFLIWQTARSSDICLVSPVDYITNLCCNIQITNIWSIEIEWHWGPVHTEVGHLYRHTSFFHSLINFCLGKFLHVVSELFLVSLWHLYNW